MNDETLVPLDLSDAIALIDRQKQQITALKAERDKAIEDVTILTQQRRSLLDERAALKAEIEQWKRVVVTHVEEIERLKEARTS